MMHLISWWRENKAKYPILFEMIALDILVKQVSSVASESTFSTSGGILKPHMSCLTHMVKVIM